MTDIPPPPPEEQVFSPGQGFDVEHALKSAASEFNLDPHLLRAVAMQESKLNSNARSPKGAGGVMQVMASTARDLGFDPNDPAQNVRAGAAYLSKQLADFGGNVPHALAAYNAGPGAVRKYGGVPPYKETQNYVKAITGNLGPPPPPSEGDLFGAHSAAPPLPPPEDQIFKPGTTPVNAPASQRVDAHGNHPNMLQAGIMDLTNSPVWKDLTGAFQSAAVNGFGGLVARKGFELAGVPKDQVNQAVLAARAQTAQQVHDNAQNVNVLGHQVDPVALAGGLVGSADPTLAIPIPGLGGAVAKLGLKGAAAVAGRIAGNAAGHAAFGSASDAAYQGADIIDGLQKKFDVKRNLEAATSLGVLGGLGGAAHEVAPFIEDLFSKRGVDTTPSANPQGKTTPFTGQGLKPEELQQYHEILKTGNEHDIRGFFDERNTPAPSFADAHEWVKRRDGTDVPPPPPESEFAASAAKTGDELTKDIVGPVGDQRPAIQAHIDEQTKDWKNKPDYELINHTDDIQDPDVKAAAKAANADDPGALGFYGADGKVRVFANKVDSPETLNALIYHESLGHHGLAEQFGGRLDATIQTLLDRNVGKFGADVTKYQKKNPKMYGGDRIRAGEEVLAKMSEDGTLKPSVGDALSGTMRRFGRRMGLDLSYSDGEVRQILRMSHDAVVNGKGRNVAANGFKTGDTTPPKFMFTGPKARDYDPNHITAYKAKDGITRNEISDREAKLLPSGKFQRQYLDDVLDHPTLYDEYPELRNVVVNHAKMAEGVSGEYNPNSHSILLNSDEHDPTAKLKTVLHETQHAIQHIENIPGFLEVADHQQSTHAEYMADPIEKEAFATEGRSSLGYIDRIEDQPKFMRRDEAAETDYVAHDLEGIYKALDRDYVPQTRSFDEVRRSALEAGFKPSQIKDLKDVGDLSTKLYRMQAAANMADGKLAELNKILGTDAWTYDHQAEYLKTLSDRDYLVNRIRGNRSEIARALNISKAASSYNLSTMQAVADMMREEGSGLAELAADPVKFMKFAEHVKALMNGGNKAGAHVLVAGVNKPYWEDYMTSLHFTFMLGRLSTQFKAMADMSTGVIRNVLDKSLAVPIGEVRKGVQTLRGKTALPGVSMHEVAAHTYGLVNAVTDGEVWRATAKAAKTGDNSWVMPDGTTTPAHFGTLSNTKVNLGPVVGLPGNLVSAHDTFFRAANMNAELRGLGMRKAIEDLGPKASASDLHAQASYYAYHPTIGMVGEAKDLTNRTLLLNSNPVNKWLDQIKARGMEADATPVQRGLKFLAMNLAPFIRVESNALHNRIIQRSPLAFFDPYTRKQLAAGGANADIALARIAYGTGMMVMAAMAGNKLTGEVSSDPAKRKELLAGGETMNSVHEDGQYRSGNSLPTSVLPWDIHNSTAQMVKGAMEAYKDGSKENFGTGLKMASYVTMKDLADMTWASTLAPYIDSLTARDNMSAKMSHIAADQAKTWIPGELDQAERMTDHKRDIAPDDPGNALQAMGRSIQSSIPGLANKLPLKYSVYGQPMDTGASFEGVHTPIPGLPGNRTPEPTDPGIKEMNRLAKLTPAAIVTAPMKSMTVGPGMKVKLTTEQFEEYQMYAGQTITQAVNDQIKSGQWSSMSDTDKVYYIKDVQKQAKSEVRDALLQKEGFLKPEQIEKLRTQSDGK